MQAELSSTSRARLLYQRCLEVWGSEPLLYTRAPGRVDLMGSHTDYNLGYVLAVSISRDTWIAATPRNDETIRVHSMTVAAETCFNTQRIGRDREQPWSNYIRGVARVLQENGIPLRGFDAVVHSNIPLGRGLSSSAALECATAVVIEELAGLKLDDRKRALLCQKAENSFVGVNCGILDQFTSCLGREGTALFLDCRDLSTQSVPIAEGISVVICDTGAERELRNSDYGLRRQQCEEAARLLGVSNLRDVMSLSRDEYRKMPWDVSKRARFIIEENERVLSFKKALSSGAQDAIAQFCSDSFTGARDLYEICSPSMLTMMSAMRESPGCIGARQTGAGFGGCMVAFVESAAVADFAESVKRAYRRTSGITPEVYPVQAAEGSGLLHVETSGVSRPTDAQPVCLK